MLRIPAHQLVGPLAGKHHLHAARGQLRKHEDWNIGGFADRRSTAQHGSLPIIHECAGFDDQFLMIGAKLLGNDARMIEL